MLHLKVNNVITIIGDNLQRLSSFIAQNCIVENPDYKAALKQQRSVKSIQQYYHFSENKNNSIEITRGLLNILLNFLRNNWIKYEIEYDYKENEKIDIETKIDKLRSFQLNLEEKLGKTNWGYGIVPTWGWKTVVMINEIVKNKSKTFLLIHNKKLLYQFIDRLKQFSNVKDEDIWIYWDKKKEIKPITIALMQSFWKLKEREIQEITNDFDLFFIDEAHHLIANTLLKIWKNVKSKRFYWLTATPDKKDWMALQFLEKIMWPLIERVTEEELEEQWIIIKPTLKTIINNDSFVKDMYNDFFKFKDRKINKLYISDIKDNDNLLPLSEKETTLIIGSSKDEIYTFYNRLPENIKKQIKIIYTPIFKRSQKILEQYKIVIAYDTPEQYRRIDMNKIKRKLYCNLNRSNIISNIIIKEFKSKELNKDPNILIISDQIAHLEFMYNNMPEVLKKYAVVLTWKIFWKTTKKALAEAAIVEEKINKKEIRIIFAIEKFVWEGWDVSHLDNIIMSYLLKDHELLKQLVWRVVRSSPNKKYAQVYDIIDINNPICFNQFKKRFQNYYQKRTNYNQEEINKIIYF